MNGEVAEPREFLGLLPRIQLGELVGAHQQVQRRRLAQGREKIAHRVDRVRTSGATNLDIRRHEVAIALGPLPHHRQPMLRGGQVACLLMRWRRGWNEIHQVELEGLANFLRRAQMPEMNRIETTAEQYYPQLILSLPIRRNRFALNSGADLSGPAQHVLISGQFVESHRPARVQPIGRNSSLGAESKFETVSKTRRRVDVNRSRIDFAFKARSRLRIAGDDRVRQM